MWSWYIPGTVILFAVWSWYIPGTVIPFGLWSWYIPGTVIPFGLWSWYKEPECGTGSVSVRSASELCCCL
jgi:hypothetical protein